MYVPTSVFVPAYAFFARARVISMECIDRLCITIVSDIEYVCFKAKQIKQLNSYAEYNCHINMLMFISKIVAGVYLFALWCAAAFIYAKPTSMLYHVRSLHSRIVKLNTR